jgi:hypothetical protein
MEIEIHLYLFFNFDARWEMVVNATPLLVYSRCKDPEHIVQKVGWAPGSLWTGAQNIPSPGF